MSVVTSMTGFGRAGGDLSGRVGAAVVVRSVNHRYLDVSIRTNLRDELPEVEAAVRDRISAAVRRGRVQVQLNIERRVVSGASVLVDGGAVEELLAQLQSLELPGAGTVALGDILGLPGLVTVSGEQVVLEAAEVAALEELVGAAMEQLVAMRRAEGARLAEQVSDELADLGAFLDWFEPQMDGIRDRLLGRLRQRMAEVLGADGIPEPERLLQEAALAADRTDVAEEVVRLRAHLAQFRQRLAAGGTIGRSLDFLCQEINRELNTLGSKCREAEVSARLVDAKTAAERIREQVQNLE